MLTDKKDEMILALEQCKGIVSDAIRKVDISRQTHYNWLKSDPDYKARVEAVDDIAIDFVEGKLFSNIEDGDTTAIIFYLKTKAKKRGYIEKSDIGISFADDETIKRREHFLKKIKEIQGEQQNGDTQEVRSKQG